MANPRYVPSIDAHRRVRAFIPPFFALKWQSGTRYATIRNTNQMALGKFYEDIVDARRENGAAIVFEYQYPRENAKPRVRIETLTEPAPYKLTFRDRIALRVFVLKLESDGEQVSPGLLKQTRDWSPAHFNELARRSPIATARLAIAYRDEVIKLKAQASAQLAGEDRNEASKPKVQEPPFRAVTPNKNFVVEIRKRRTNVRECV